MRNSCGIFFSKMSDNCSAPIMILRSPEESIPAKWLDTVETGKTSFNNFSEEWLIMRRKA